jgi:hypothetical protein
MELINPARLVSPICIVFDEFERFLAEEPNEA